VLAERFDIVCGGPESVAQFGSTPRRCGATTPSTCPPTPPLNGTAEGIEPTLSRVVAAQPGTWVPVTLHLGWAADQSWTALERLAETMAPHARPWSEVLGALDATRV
jgi:hypothetical protein